MGTGEAEERTYWPGSRHRYGGALEPPLSPMNVGRAGLPEDKEHALTKPREVELDHKLH